MLAFRHLTDPATTLESMLRPKVVSLPGHIQSVFVQNILKLYAHVVTQAEGRDDSEAVMSATTLLVEKLPMFVASSDLEVQERVFMSRTDLRIFERRILYCCCDIGMLCRATHQIRSTSAREKRNRWRGADSFVCR